MESFWCVNFNVATLLQSLHLKRPHSDSLRVRGVCLMLAGVRGKYSVSAHTSPGLFDHLSMFMTESGQV